MKTTIYAVQEEKDDYDGDTTYLSYNKTLIGAINYLYDNFDEIYKIKRIYNEITRYNDYTYELMSKEELINQSKNNKDKILCETYKVVKKINIINNNGILDTYSSGFAPVSINEEELGE